MKSTLYSIFSFAIFCSGVGFAFGAPVLKTADSLKVDGVYQNWETVVNSRSPKFSWEFNFDAGTGQGGYDIEIGTYTGGAEVWSINRSGSINSVIYYGSPLESDTTYYWRIKVYDDNLPPADSGWQSSYFCTVTSAKPLADENVTLKIDWNNPFNPNKGEITKIRYGLNSSTEEVVVNIFSITGEFVDAVANHVAEKNAIYTAVWDGKNANGEVAASGIYFVNLRSGDGKSKTVKLAVIK